MVKVKRLLSVFLCLFIFFANTNALCAKAAPLSTAESKKIATAIDATTKSQSSSSDYSAALRNGKLTFIKSFQITGLEAPQNGRLLDDTATVTTDNGVSWDIPVLWVNNEGDLIKVGIELDDNVRSYPVFAFYLPAGYALAFGEKTTYDIKMPDFVTNLFSKTGVATLSNPNKGITYITPTLPGKDKVLVRIPASYYEESTPSSSQGESQDGMPTNDDPDIPWHDWSILYPDDLQYKDYNPDFTEAETLDIASKHGSKEAIDAIGADNVAWLVSYIKDVIEPEAVSLLIQKFPAYAEAAANGELGKDLGVYIYYSEKESDPAVAYVKAVPNDDDGSVEYVLAVNSYYYYTLVDGVLNDNPSYSDASDIELDTTIIHEVMHALMDDYTRTGMLGMQYVADLDTYTYNDDALFPSWFVEGIATAVGSPYQYWHDSLTTYYGYDGDSYSYLKEAYLADEEMHLDYSDGKKLTSDSDTRKSAYISGYLANVYLGYLAAMKYDGLNAITEYEDGTYSINSTVIRSGVNHILEELHDGKTLDDIIFEISEIGDTVLYLDTDDFADKFIANEDENLTDNGVSLAFCTMFLDYLEDNSYGEYVANGSILTDFTDLSQTLLSPDLLNNTYEVLELTDSKDMVKSTVDPLLALTSGGKSEDGITTLEDLNGNLAAFPASNVAMSAGDSSDTDAKANETAASDTKLKAGASDDSDAKVKTEEATAAEAKAKAEGTVAADTKLTTGKAAVTDSKAKAEETVTADKKLTAGEAAVADSKAKAEETVTADKKLTAGEAAVADAKAEEYTDADAKTKIGESPVADTKAKADETVATDEKIKTVEAVVADAKQNAEESAASTKAGKATTDGEKSKVVETSNESAKSDSKETADSTNNKNDHSKDNARTLDSSKNSDAATASENSETQTVLLTSKKSVPDDSSAAKSDTATAVEEGTKEISSIFDAIQVGIDEHEEIAENRSVNNDTTASADTPANEVEPKSESTATEDAATTTKEDTQKSDSTDSSISQEDAHEDSNDNSGNDDSDQSQLTAEELKDVQAVKDAIASGQISSLTPDQLSLLSSGQVDLTGADTKTSDTAIQETAGQTASSDSIKDASKESDIKSTDDSTSGTAQDKSTGSEEKSIVSDNEKAESATSENIESADKASFSKDETNGSSDSKSGSSDTSSESSDAKSENSDAAPSSDSQADGNDASPSSDSQAGGNDATTAQSDSQAGGNDASPSSDSQAGGNDATTAPSDTTGNEEAVTDTPAPEPTESVSEPDNIPAGIIISESEPEPEEAPDDNSEEQQILDAMPTSDDSEDDAAPEAPTPTE